MDKLLISVCIRVCMYVCVCVCIYIYIYIYILGLGPIIPYRRKVFWELEKRGWALKFILSQMVFSFCKICSCASSLYCCVLCLFLLFLLLSSWAILRAHVQHMRIKIHWNEKTINWYRLNMNTIKHWEPKSACEITHTGLSWILQKHSLKAPGQGRLFKMPNVVDGKRSSLCPMLLVGTVWLFHRQHLTKL